MQIFVFSLQEFDTFSLSNFVLRPYAFLLYKGGGGICFDALL